MSLGIENIHRSNHSIIFPQSYGSPLNDITKHISGLGLRRLDFERCAVAVEGALLDRKHVLGELPDFKWRYESLWVLLWALGHMEDLGAPEIGRASCREGRRIAGGG